MDKNFLSQAIEVSKESILAGGYPVGALIVKGKEIISIGRSLGNLNNDSTMHAEMDAIRTASKKLGRKFLQDCVLYSSCEPCRMCFSASIWARIPKIIYTLKKEFLPNDFFESKETIEDLSSNTKNKIELVYLSELENTALEVIQEWKNKKL